MNQRKDKERPKIVDHRHCIICGRAIPYDEQFCSPDCREKYEISREREKKSRMMLILVYIVLIVVMVLFFILMPRT